MAPIIYEQPIVPSCESSPEPRFPLRQQRCSKGFPLHRKSAPVPRRSPCKKVACLVELKSWDMSCIIHCTSQPRRQQRNREACTSKTATRQISRVLGYQRFTFAGVIMRPKSAKSNSLLNMSKTSAPTRCFPPIPIFVKHHSTSIISILVLVILELSQLSQLKSWAPQDKPTWLRCSGSSKIISPAAAC